MKMKYFIVLETVTIQKIVRAATAEKARKRVFQEMPKYGVAGWVPVNSSEPTISEVKE